MRRTLLTLATALLTVAAPLALATPAQAFSPNAPVAHDDVVLVAWGEPATEIDLTANDDQYVVGYGRTTLLTAMTPRTLPSGMGATIGQHGYLAIYADRTSVPTEPLVWTYSLTDQFGESTATVTVVVTGVPGAPRACADRATVSVGGRTLLAPLVNDGAPAGLAARPTLLPQRRTAGLRAYVVAGSHGRVVVVRAARRARPGLIVIPYRLVDALGRTTTGLIRVRITTAPHRETTR